MVIPPTKDLAAQVERTIDTELPQELTKLPEPFGFAATKPRPKSSTPTDRGGSRRKVRRPKNAPVLNGFPNDDGHPTILAAGRG